MKKYITQLYYKPLEGKAQWGPDVEIDARAMLEAAESSMNKHVYDDPEMLGSEWTIRVQLSVGSETTRRGMTPAPMPPANAWNIYRMIPTLEIEHTN